MKWCMLLIFPCIVVANPVFYEIINEFQVAGSSANCIEFRFLVDPALDTLYTAALPLINTIVATPAGSSYIDTNIFLQGPECLTIDGSVLSGPFWLPYSAGHVKVYNESLYIWDSIFYPGHANQYPSHAPTPPSNCSAAKYHCFYYDSLSWYHPWYLLLTDWYIDYTPTFGAPNDDYPGCMVSGYVYDSSSCDPIADARVIATLNECWGIIYNPQGHHKCCTTYTATDGSFSFDSLLPYHYYMNVAAEGYYQNTYYTEVLCCTDPLNNLCFNLQLGIVEFGEEINYGGLSVYPNPFRNMLNISVPEPHCCVEMYDITGELVMKAESTDRSNVVMIDGEELPAGVYFLCVAEKKIKVIKL